VEDDGCKNTRKSIGEGIVKQVRYLHRFKHQMNTKSQVGIAKFFGVSPAKTNH
jgi:hypothetical protein